MSNTPSASSNTNPQMAIVPQNNLAQEQDYCPSCYFPYEKCVCQWEESSQALVTQEQVVGKSYNVDGSQLHQGQHSFMNH